ncbi:unnamed protein product [Paramecium sonneborni]|uniref:Uncharacterized protein n=1 Tax=Paramecium sonneborni TaxID=65129 RepID=A0A8S1R5S9_9CILI|nr:unnamed protein product [Paramecium sonneborni]
MNILIIQTLLLFQYLGFINLHLRLYQLEKLYILEQLIVQLLKNQILNLIQKELDMEHTFQVILDKYILIYNNLMIKKIVGLSFLKMIQLQQKQK